MQKMHVTHDLFALVKRLLHPYLPARFETPGTVPASGDASMAAIDFSRPFNAGFGLRLSRFFGVLADWNDRRITRKALGKLTDRELDDIGLCRGDLDQF